MQDAGFWAWKPRDQCCVQNPNQTGLGSKTTQKSWTWDTEEFQVRPFILLTLTTYVPSLGEKNIIEVYV